MKTYYRNETNLRIINHTIKELDGKEKRALWLENCNKVIIENVRVFTSELTGLTIKNCREVTLKNCSFDGSVREQGIQIINSIAIALENVTCQKNAIVGMSIEHSRDVTVISSNFLANGKAGVKIADSNQLTFKNTTFDGSAKGPGINLSNVSVIHLENIKASNNANGGIEIQKGSHDISIIASACSDNVKVGLRLTESNQVTCRDLQIYHTQNGNGLSFKEGQQLEFINCHFDNNHSGVHLQNCSEVVFKTSTFSQNKMGSGLYFNQVNNAQLQQCQFNHNNNYALVLVQSKNISCRESQIHFNGQYGKFTKSEVEIIDCDIRGQGSFELCHRSELKTNIEERPFFQSLYQGTIFRRPSQSRNKKLLLLVILLLLILGFFFLFAKFFMKTSEPVHEKPTPVALPVNPPVAINQQNTTESSSESLSTTKQESTASSMTEQGPRAKPEPEVAPITKPTPQLNAQALSIQDPVGFIISYYNDINKYQVDSVISKWKAPKRERLKQLVKGAEKENKKLGIKLQLLEQNGNQAKIYCEVNESKDDITTQKWSGTITLEKVTSEWKIVKMRFSEVK